MSVNVMFHCIQGHSFFFRFSVRARSGKNFILLPNRPGMKAVMASTCRAVKHPIAVKTVSLMQGVNALQSRFYLDPCPAEDSKTDVSSVSPSSE